jgi:hypothetical protein
LARSPGQAERLGDRAAMVRHDAGGRIDREGDDLFGRVMRDVSMSMPPSVETTKATRRRFAVDQQREVEFLLDVRAVLDVEAVDLLAGGPVWMVTSVLPSISGVGFFTSATDLARRTPPLASAGSSLNLPLPRPPAWIWLFTT